MEAYRNADLRTHGKATSLLDAWTCLGPFHRFGQKVRWYCRTGQPEVRFIPAPEMEDGLI